MNANFYCKTCLDALVRSYVNTFNDAKTYGMINCLASFNMDNVLHDRDDIDAFKIIIGNAIEEQRSAISTACVLFDSPIAYLFKFS